MAHSPDHTHLDAAATTVAAASTLDAKPSKPRSAAHKNGSKVRASEHASDVSSNSSSSGRVLGHRAKMMRTISSGRFQAAVLLLILLDLAIVITSLLLELFYPECVPGTRGCMVCCSRHAWAWQEGIVHARLLPI